MARKIGYDPISLRLKREVIRRAQRIAEEQGRTRAAVLVRWLEFGMVAEESFSWNPDSEKSARTRLADILKAEKDGDGAPRFAPAGDRPLVGSAAGLAGTPENSTPFQMPQWRDARLRELADAEPGGLMACSPELLAEFKEMAKTDPAVAATLERAGVKAEVGHGTEERDQRATQTGGYSRAKGSHPGTPQASAQPGDSEGGADSRGFMVGGNRVQDTSGSDGTGDLGTPVVKTQKSQNEILNDLAWGEMQDGLYNNGAEEPPPDAEIDLCGHTEHVWETGEWVACGLPKGHRGRHGKPVKVEGPE